MSGMNQPGGVFPGLERPKTGFAQYMPSSGEARRTAEREAKQTKEKGLTAERPRFVSKHPGPARTIWPKVVVQRVIDGRESRPDWKTFTSRFATAGERLGDVVALSEYACVYLTSDEFDTMLSKRYPQDDRRKKDVDPGRPRRLARGVITRLNEQMQAVQYNNARTIVSLKRPYETTALWQPGNFEVGRQFASPEPYTTTIPLLSENFPKERQDVVNILASRDFGMDVSDISPQWDSDVVILDNMKQQRSSRQAFPSASYPFTLPLSAPNGYIEKVN